LISGSGPQNRDEELFGHKPFLVIADYLTNNGISVLRIDDRGVAMSEADFYKATTADFSNDIESAVDYLYTINEVDTNKIGLIGHSEGGVIAPMVASRNSKVNYIVLLAGKGIQGDSLLLLQQQLIARASGVSEIEVSRTIKNNRKFFDMILNTNDVEKLNEKVSIYLVPGRKLVIFHISFPNQKVGC